MDSLDCEDRVKQINDRLVQLQLRFRTSQDLNDVEEAILLAREGLDLLDKTCLGWPTQLYWLGSTLYKKYKLVEDVPSLEEAIELTRNAVELSPEDSQERKNRSFFLAAQLGDYYYHTLDLSDLDQSITLLRVAVDHASQDNRSNRLGNLGITIKEKYKRTRSGQDFKDASEALREALNPDLEDENLVIWLETLAELCDERFGNEGELGILEEVVHLRRQIIAKMDVDDPFKPERQSKLAAALAQIYTWTGNLEEIQEAIDVEIEALDATSKSDPERFIRIGNITARLYSKYLQTGDLDSLETCIQLGRYFLKEAPEDHEHRPAHQDNLSVYLGYKYDMLGNLDDLEEAIQTGREAVAALPADNSVSDWPVTLGNLATNLSARYRTTGALNDLEEAITLKRRVLVAKTDGVNLHNLTVGLLTRYDRLEDLADVEEAIDLSKRAVGLTKDDDMNMPIFLNDIVGGLSRRFSKLKQTQDLDDGIRLGRQAIAAGGGNYVERSTCYKTVSNLLRLKFKTTRELTDLDESIKLMKEGKAITQDDDPHSGFYSARLGGMYMDRFSFTEEKEDLANSISAYKFAVNQPTGYIQQRITAAASAMPLCATNEELAYEIGQEAVRLVPLLSGRSLETSDKQWLMSQAVGLASNTAAAALWTGRTPLHALSLLEMGRGVLMASLEDMRTDIVDLKEQHPELADEFIRLRSELDTRVGSSPGMIDGENVDTLNTRGHRRHDAGKAFDALVLRIRQQSGFEAFLGPLGERDIQSAAERGPVVVLNVSNICCDAILVERHRVQALRLGVSDDEIADMAMVSHLGSSDVLEWLWVNITGPVLDALGIIRPPADDGWPHVWWIPTGPLRKFPFHASGLHKQLDGQTVMDRAVSSYSPSIKALIQGRRRRPAQTTFITPPKALMVAIDHTPGQLPLPYASQEVASLRRLCDTMSLAVIEPEGDRDEILKHLKDTQIFHFAGHGYTHTVDPAQSHLCLNEADAPLTVADLFDINLHQQSPFLAYLSACGTGQIKDEKFADESIHLISACQLAGFRNVIGTMWGVSDEHCVDVARVTYESLRDEGLTDEAVCRGLHRATRMLRDRWVEPSAHEMNIKISNLGRAVDETLSLHDEAVGNTDGVREGRDVLTWDERNDGHQAEWVPYVHFGV